MSDPVIPLTYAIASLPDRSVSPGAAVDEPVEPDDLGVMGDRPPVVEDMMVFVRPKRAATFELGATDDGHPDPPGKLSYTVASLPQHGQLNSGGQFLTEPTTLAGFAAQLTYFPDQDFMGQDTFTFYADDGGSAPAHGHADGHEHGNVRAGGPDVSGRCVHRKFRKESELRGEPPSLGIAHQRAALCGSGHSAAK